MSGKALLTCKSHRCSASVNPDRSWPAERRRAWTWFPLRDWPMRYYFPCCFLLAVHHSHILTSKIIQSVSQTRSPRCIAVSVSRPRSSLSRTLLTQELLRPLTPALQRHRSRELDQSLKPWSYLCGKQDGEESILGWWWKEVKRRALLSALQASDRNESGRMRVCRPRWREGRRSTGKEREEKEARRDCEAQIRLRCCGNAGPNESTKATESRTQAEERGPVRAYHTQPRCTHGFL
jgi:hypothetical protein